jgi:hypothetical protein
MVLKLSATWFWRQIRFSLFPTRDRPIMPSIFLC